MRMIIISVCFLLAGCEGFLAQVPCETGRAAAQAAAFLFCQTEDVDDETKVYESEKLQTEL